MKAFILSIFLFISVGTCYRFYKDFDSKFFPFYESKCVAWGGQGSLNKKFNFQCIKEKKNNQDLEKEYQYIFYGTIIFMMLVVGLFFFSVQGNKNDE